MDSRLVLVIEGDEPTAQRLAAAIREADYEVVVSNSARAGLDIAIEIKPDCVVCEVELPDEDGYWVARNIRTHASAVAVTPFLFLSGFDDPESRLEGFNVGADVYMTKPFEAEEVVGQVDALVKLASRLRQRRDSMLSAAPEQTYGSTAIEGDVRQMSIATVLSVLGMERRTGVFEVVSKKRRAQIEIAGGYVVHGTIGGTRVTALAAMRVMMSWKVGRFSFTPLPPCDAPPSLRTVQALLLDAAKAEDEGGGERALVRLAHAVVVRRAAVAAGRHGAAVVAGAARLAGAVVARVRSGAEPPAGGHARGGGVGGGRPGDGRLRASESREHAASRGSTDQRGPRTA